MPVEPFIPTEMTRTDFTALEAEVRWTMEIPILVTELLEPEEERKKAIAYAILKEGATYEDLAIRYKIQPSRIRQLYQGVLYRMHSRFSYIFRNIAEVYDLRAENAALRAEIGRMAVRSVLEKFTPAMAVPIYRCRELYPDVWEVLTGYDIRTVGELAVRKRDEVIRFKGIGRKNIKLLDSLLEKRGLQWEAME